MAEDADEEAWSPVGGAGLTDLSELFGFDEGGRYHCVVRVTHRVEPIDRKQARWTVSVSTEEPRCLHAVVFAVDDGIGRELPVRAPPFELTRTSESGSLFTLRLPCVEAPRAESATPEPDAPSRPVRFDGVDVLVVDDNPTNRLVLDRLLARLGATVHLTESGQKALELLAGRPFDLVLMDIMMPEMDGNETTRRLRELDVAWSSLPVVALSAAVFDEDRDAALAAGMDDFLEKPVRLDVLEQTLVRHCGPPSDRRS